MPFVPRLVTIACTNVYEIVSDMMIPCSIAMITLNSAKTLRRALESVREFDDIVIFDGNSTDGTPEIAREFGARVFSQSPSGPPNYRLSDFGAEKQKAVDAARGPWVFILDSDEWMSKELVEEIRRMVSGPPAVCMIPRMLVLNDRVIKYAFFYPDYYPRFFHMSTGAHFEVGRVLHEKIKFAPEAKMMKLVNPIYHTWLSYAESLIKDEANRILVLQQQSKRRMSFGHYFYWVVFRDTLTLIRVITKMILVWLRHPGPDTLPWRWNWRVIRAEMLQARETSKLVLRSYEYGK